MFSRISSIIAPKKQLVFSSSSSSTPVSSPTALFCTTSSTITREEDLSSSARSSNNNNTNNQSVASSVSHSQPLLASIISFGSDQQQQQKQKMPKIQSLIKEITTEMQQLHQQKLSNDYYTNDDDNGPDPASSHEQACIRVSDHYQLLQRTIIFYLGTNLDVINSFSFHIPSVIEIMTRKLILLREEAQPNDFESASYINELFNLALGNDSSNNNSKVMIFQVLTSLSLGVVSSNLANSDDVLTVLTSMRTLIMNNHQQEDGNNSSSNNSSSSSFQLSDNDRLDISKVIKLSKQRLEQILKPVDTLIYEGHSVTEENTIVQCFHSIFPLILQGPFTESAELLDDVSSLFEQKVLRSFFKENRNDTNKNTNSKTVSPTDPVCSSVKQICYVISVLARRPACSAIAKPLLLSVLDSQTNFIIKSSMLSSSSSSSSNHHLTAATSHSLIAFNVLNEPEKLLDLISKISSSSSSSTSDEKSSSQQQQQQHQHQHHWTTAWALARTGQVDTALDVLVIVAKSRPKGWTGVPARIRHVFQSVASQVQTLEQLQNWCRAVSAMKCASMRVDYENLVPVLLGIEIISKRNKEVILEIARILAGSGLFQSDASRIVRHLLSSEVTGRSVRSEEEEKEERDDENSENSESSFKVTQQEQEDLVCDMVNAWRRVVTSNHLHKGEANNNMGNNHQQLCILDSRLLEFLLFDHGRNNTNRHRQQNPSWIRYIAKNPNLLLPGSLPQHTRTTLLDRLDLIMMNNNNNINNSSTQNSLVKSLHKLATKIQYDYDNNNNTRQQNDDDQRQEDNSYLVWTCQLCDTSNTYIHSTCGNDSCQAPRFSPIQCGSCAFINPSHATKCDVCSTSFNKDHQDNTNINDNDVNSNNTSYILRPFGKWKCSSCGERERNVPSPSVTSGIRCAKCSQITGPLNKYIVFDAYKSNNNNNNSTYNSSPLICGSCNRSPNQGDLISSQNPVCVVDRRAGSGNDDSCDHGTLIPISKNIIKKNNIPPSASSSSSSSSLWNCIQCGEKNQNWRERCAKCVQVPKIVTGGDDDQATAEIESEIFSSGFWKCLACGTQTNSTLVDQSCSSCQASIELNCAEIMTASSMDRAELQGLKRKLEMNRKRQELKKKQEKLLGSSKKLEDMSVCSICNKATDEVIFRKPTNVVNSEQNDTTKSKTTLFSGGGEATNDENAANKDQLRLHIGDFCVNPKCNGSPLPLSSLLNTAQDELSHLLSMSFENASATSSLLMSGIEETSATRNANRSSNSAVSILQVSTLAFQLTSIRHNLQHLISLLVSTDSRTETGALQKASDVCQLENEIEDNNKKKSLMSDHQRNQHQPLTINTNQQQQQDDEEQQTKKRKEVLLINNIGLAHRLIRTCCERIKLLHDLILCCSPSSSPSSASLDLIVEFEEDPQVKTELNKLKQVSIEMISVCSTTWKVMTDSYTRGSLSAAVGTVLHTFGLVSSQSQQQQQETLPLIIKTLLEDQRRCRWCLGKHPESMCPKNGDLKNFSPSWTCNECGEVSNDVREGAQRYVCKSCLGVRPEVLQLDDDSLWAEVWECPECKRATPMIEDNCIFCPFIRKHGGRSDDDDDSDAANSNKFLLENSLSSEKEEDLFTEDTSEMIDDDDQDSSPSSGRLLHSSTKTELRVTTTLPFFPARCGLCGEVHFEALCPVCSRGDILKTQITNAFGVISRIYPSMLSSSLGGKRDKKKLNEKINNSNNNKNKAIESSSDEKTSSSSHQDVVVATVQPHGTAGRNSLVLVPLSVLPKDKQGGVSLSSISVGSFVRFDAQRSTVDIQSPRVASSTKSSSGATSKEVVNFRGNHSNNNEKNTSSSSALCATSITIV